MSVPKDQMNVDGIKSDGVGHDVATPEQLATFDEARAALSRFRAPVLVRADNPHERLFIAAFDGTGNDKYAAPEHAMNVAKIDTQIKALGDERVYANYVPGPGTQDNPLVRTWDQIRGFSYEDRLEKMYDELVQKAAAWYDADPTYKSACKASASAAADGPHAAWNLAYSITHAVSNELPARHLEHEKELV